MYEHIALGYRSSLALCSTKVRAVDIQIMSEYDQTFGPKLLTGHCDLLVHGSVILPCISALNWYMIEYK